MPGDLGQYMGLHRTHLSSGTQAITGETSFSRNSMENRNSPMDKIYLER
jgi:hypothetical protein